MACYDIEGKDRNMPVYQLLGATKNRIQTDITIGIDTPEKMKDEALVRVAEGFRILKIKATPHNRLIKGSV